MEVNSRSNEKLYFSFYLLGAGEEKSEPRNRNKFNECEYKSVEQLNREK